MLLTLTRQKDLSTDTSTIGILTCEGKHVCYILEDVDRGLEQTHPLNFIASKKVFGKTAIPTGRYEIIINFSERFKKPLPLLLNVPGFKGIRIHAGNVAADTDGCLLPGTAFEHDKVINSRAAFVPLAHAIETAIEKEKVFIEIKRWE